MLKEDVILLVIIALILAAVLGAVCQGADGAVPTPSISSLLAAIRQIESGGREDPPDGDGGLAIGLYQIHRAYWADSGVPGRYVDCRGEAYSRCVVVAYWRRHARAALAAGNVEVLARIHNGGPRGGTKPATRAYARRVLAALDAGAK